MEGGATVGAFIHWVPLAGLRCPEPKPAFPASLALSLAILLMYAAPMSGGLADYDAPTRLIWEMWAKVE